MSWSRYEALGAMAETGAILIVRLPTAEAAHAVARAAIAGGIRAIEITLSVPGALGVIRALDEEYRARGVLIGAGTVLDAASAMSCLDAGARLLVSPNLEPEMIRTANRHGAVTASGAFTPSEVVRTLEAGADLVKLFPTEIAPAA
jgi:2-dehydro-3-deoxyphosphogluconate aldolase / (4S)-4-hydroxy-2-oxoglutarate aldolase